MGEHKVGIVGGGISGLALAYELQKRGTPSVIFEKEKSVGGRVQTRKKDGLAFDTGASFFLPSYKKTFALCEELGLSIAPIQPGDKDYLKEGAVYPIETKTFSILTGMRFLSWRSKGNLVRLMASGMQSDQQTDLYDLAQNSETFEENGFEFIITRYGQEVAEFVDTVTRGYHFYGIRDLTPAAILAMISLLHEHKDSPNFCLPDGIGSLTTALAKILPLRIAEGVEKVYSKEGKKWIETANGKYAFDTIVFCIPAPEIKKIYHSPSNQQKKVLETASYSLTIMLSFLIEEKFLKGHVAELIPFREGQKICIVGNEGIKGGAYAEDGRTLLSVALQEEYAGKVFDLPRELLFKEVKNEILRTCPFLKGAISALTNYDLEKIPYAMPKFTPRAQKEVRCFLENGQGENGVFFCCDFLFSPWIEGCLRQACRVARQVLPEHR